MKSLFGHAERERKEGWGEKGMGIGRVGERGEERRPQRKEEREGDRDRTRHFKNM